MNVVFFIITYISSQLLFAQDKLPLKQKSEATINKLLQLNITEINKLNLIDLKKKVKDIEYVTIPNNKFPNFAGDRSSAYYINGKIYSYQIYSNEPQESIKFLATHEALGSLGFKDKNYEQTILLELLANSSEAKRKKLLQHPIINWEMGHKIRLGEGGATGVGGGGDNTAGWFKYLVIQKFMSSPHWTSEVINLLEVEFEPYPETKGINYVSIVPASKLTDFHKGLRDVIVLYKKTDPDFMNYGIFSFKFLIPVDLLKRDSIKLEEAVDEVVSLLEDLYFSIYEVADLQLSILADCKYRTLRVPSLVLKNEMMIRSGGIQQFIDNFYQECEFMYGK